MPAQPRSRFPLHAAPTRRALLASAAALAAGMAAPVRPVAARQDGDPVAVDLLRRAAEAIAAASSFHFALTTPLGETRILEALELLAIEGDVLRPDRFRARIDARAAILDLSLTVIGVGDRLWISDPRTDGAFIESGSGGGGSDTGAGDMLAALANPDLLFLAMLRVISDPRLGPEAAIDGEPVRRVDGTVDLARLAAGPGAGAGAGSEDATPAAAAAGSARSSLASDPLPISVWLDAQDRPRRIELEGPLLEMEDPGVIRRLDLTRFDEPMTIEPPDG